jgi:alpha-beta hydrolase superfamily lysophospholipase
LQTSDREQLGGWFVRGDPGKGCAVLLHGHGASRGQMLWLMNALAEERYTVLAITLRAHGDSTGQLNDFGWSARRDVAAAVAFLQGECPGRPIYVLGSSMGAAAAIFAAGDLKNSVAGYFLEEPYKDLQSATWYRLQHALPPVLDHAAYLGLRLWGPAFLSVDPARISPYQRITDIPQDVPVVLLAGSADWRAKAEDVEAMYSRVQSHARFLLFKGAGHENLAGRDRRLYWSNLMELLEHKPGAEGKRTH